MQNQNTYYSVPEFSSLSPQINETVIFAHYGSTGGDSFTHCVLPQFKREQTMSYHVGLEHREKIKHCSNQQLNKLCFVYGHWAFGLNAILPQKSTYITLLRHPVAHFMSQYYWAKYAAADKAQRPESTTQSLRQWVDIQLSKYNPENTGGYITDFFSTPSYPWSDSWKTNVATTPVAHKTKQALENLENRFSMIAITEQFEESLFMLSALMGWDKVFYWKLKSSSGLTPAIEEIPVDLIRDIKTLTAPSIALYTKFAKRFSLSFEKLCNTFEHLGEHVTKYKKSRQQNT